MVSALVGRCRLAASNPALKAPMLSALVARAIQVDSIKPRVESAYGVCNQRLQLYYSTLLSMFAFKFNLRQYRGADDPHDGPDASQPVAPPAIA